MEEEEVEVVEDVEEAKKEGSSRIRVDKRRSGVVDNLNRKFGVESIVKPIKWSLEITEIIIRLLDYYYHHHADGN